MTSNSNAENKIIPLVPPQLPPFLANAFNLQPIVGNPSREEVKVVHEAVRALNNISHTPELRDTDLSTELSQHLFDIQMACHRQKYPINVLPHEVIYEPPTLPSYIPIELNSVTGLPSNEEIAAVHTALRISESFVNVPSIFDPNVHAELSQHLFDIQLARHVQRSITKRSKPTVSAPRNQTTRNRDPVETNANSDPAVHTSSGTTSRDREVIESTQPRHPVPEERNPTREGMNPPKPSEGGEFRLVSEAIVEIRDTLKNVNRVLVASQNSMASAFNSSKRYYTDQGGYACGLGAHSLINEYGEVPETHGLPSFEQTPAAFHSVKATTFSTKNLTEDVLARYLRFYHIGEEMIDAREELKIKSGMLEDARRLLSGRLFL